jgi:hypothetical protein
MRTTLTLDDDVASKLKEAARVTGKPFKEVVNESIRLGLQAKTQKPKRTFKVRNIGARIGMNFTNVERMLQQIEGPDYR